MPDGWRVEIVRRPPSAAIPSAAKRELLSLLEELEEYGFIDGSEPMSGYKNWYNCRFLDGRWRMVFEVNRGARTIRIISVGPRSSVYEDLKQGRRD